jgi:hypothetical protein
MNLVGKIFTVLILVMSLVFMTFVTLVHYTHKNWMDVVVNPTTGLDKQLKDKNKDNVDLKKDNERYAKELDLEKIRRRNDLTKLEGEAKELRAERTKNEKLINEKDDALRTLTAANLACQEQLKVLRADNEKLVIDIKTANTDRDAQFKKVVELTDQVNNAANERALAEKRSLELAASLQEARDVLRVLGVKNVKAALLGMPPDLQGFVTAVPRQDLVEISVGSDDGVKKGGKFEVTRGDTYIGRIEVMETQADRAVCRVDATNTRSQIQRGDVVRVSLTAK